MIIRAANALAEARRVGKLAGCATVQPDWSIVARRIREEATDDWDDTVAGERFTRKGGRFVRGRATVTGSRTVIVDGQKFRASRGLVLATGTAITAGRRAFIWPFYRLIRVPSIVGVHAQGRRGSDTYTQATPCPETPCHAAERALTSYAVPVSV